MGDTVSSLLFQPPPPTKLKEHKIIWLDKENGTRIPAFYISYKNGPVGETSRSLTPEELHKSRPDEGITLLYSHANAEDLGSIYPWCKFLSKMLRVNLLAYDYTGYGMAFEQGAFQFSGSMCFVVVRFLKLVFILLQTRPRRITATMTSMPPTDFLEKPWMFHLKTSCYTEGHWDQVLRVTWQRVLLVQNGQTPRMDPWEALYYTPPSSLSIG
jgi:hypothetical protein